MIGALVGAVLGLLWWRSQRRMEKIVTQRRTDLDKARVACDAVVESCAAKLRAIVALEKTMLQSMDAQRMTRELERGMLIDAMARETRAKAAVLSVLVANACGEDEIRRVMEAIDSDMET